jgi:hypothetical protein
MPTAVEQIIFTAVPNGIATVGETVSALISVHVAPTLSGGATGKLTDFSDFQDWPSIISGDAPNIRVTFENSVGGELADPYTAAIDTAALNSALWLELFSPASGIQYTARDGAEADFTTTPVVSYPADQVASFLQSTYTNLAVNSPTAYPSLPTLQGIYSNGDNRLGFVGERGLILLNGLWSRLSADRLDMNQAGGPAPYANDWTGASSETALAALRFYHMAAGPGLTHPALTVSPPTVDFHRALTFIGEHRALQRALGLVFDVAVPISRTGATAGLNEVVYVKVQLARDADLLWSTSSGVTYTPVNPRTQVDLSDTVFEAHAASSQIFERQLTLGDTTSFAVYEIDVDGGGLKTAQFADNLELAQSPQSGDPDSPNGPAPDAPTSYAPPSLRSIGLTVAAVNRGVQFVDALQRSATLTAGLPDSVPDLTAEDLVKGYVLDVFDEGTGNWYSTASRQVTYTAGAVPAIGPVTDEPGLDAPPRAQSDPTNAAVNQFNLPENIIRWNGWSNAAPRPGAPLQDDGSAANPSDPGPFSQLTIAVTPTAGSLPRLRFGQSYALRARIVDIAGNVIPIADGGAVGDPANLVSPLSIYGRHEPVGSPDSFNWNTPLPGESLKRLVIRDLAASLGSLRALAPNRVAESFAELHGVFDTSSIGVVSPNGGAPDPSQYAVITPAEAQRYAQGTAITLTGAVPYLPDPLSRGATLYEVQGVNAGTSQLVDFSPAAGQNWPAYRPFGLSLMPGGSQTVTVDETNRIVTYELTKGDTVILQLSSWIESSDLPALGMYNWISEFYGGAVPAAFQSDAVTGLTWALTPYTTLELVYAVRLPLLVPTFEFTGQNRALGQTFAEIYGDITYSPKSTSHTDLLAAWGEPVDNGPGTGTPQGPGVPAPNTALKPFQSTVFTIPSAETQSGDQTDRFSGRHEFFDTKHRDVLYTGQATSLFTEHYQTTVPVTVPAAGTATALDIPGYPNLGVEDGSVTVTGAGNAVYEETAAFTLDPTAGTITFLPAPAGPAPGSSVNVQFLPSVSVVSSPFGVDIPSSARPLSPEIEFIVPIYEWLKVHHTPAHVLSGRSPSALRVFMSRPWWSSGIGELLGVLTAPVQLTNGISALSTVEELYVSEWGADPVFKSRPLPTPNPQTTTFPKRVTSATNLTIDENPDVLVDVAGHSVQYDPIRELWYSDIVIDVGKSYTPMIRLALARYQPDSVPGAELSRVVLADVLSIEPGRIVTIRRKHNVLISVELAGYSYRMDGDESETGPGVAELVLERRVPAIHDEVLGWEPVGKAVAMNPVTFGSDLTVWSAREIHVPAAGEHRLYITQYEVIPDDPRGQDVFATFVNNRGLRILYQDIIPL